LGKLLYGSSVIRVVLFETLKHFLSRLKLKEIELYIRLLFKDAILFKDLIV